MARVMFTTTTLILLIAVYVAGGVLMASARELDAAAAHADSNNDEVAMGELEDGVVNVMPEGLCGYKSKTFSGQCVQRRSCAYQCQTVEHAAAGACHFHHLQRHCYCYRYC